MVVHVNNSLSGRCFFLASRLTIVSLDSQLCSCKVDFIVKFTKILSHKNTAYTVPEISMNGYQVTLLFTTAIFSQSFAAKDTRICLWPKKARLLNIGNCEIYNPQALNDTVISLWAS